MKQFSQLLENLLFSPRRNDKLAHLVSWLRAASGDSRGFGVAAITGDLNLPHVKGKMIRDLASSATDEVLFALSYDFVGDLAETVSLLWPKSDVPLNSEFSIEDIVSQLQTASRKESEILMRHWLDHMPQTQKWALLKMATGGLRVGVSARLMRLAIAEAFDAAVEEIEEVWPLITPPYHDLFAWLEGQAERPSAEGRSVFRPLMLAHPLEEADQQKYDLAQFHIEWKWDGARVQLAASEEGVKLFSRSGDDISAAFPELVQPLGWQGVLDGELLAGNPDCLGSFNDLQQRLNRKGASKSQMAKQPVFMRCYDILQSGQTDVRHLPLKERKPLLEEVAHLLPQTHFDISEAVEAKGWEELTVLRDQCRDNPLIEGVMLKDKEGSYQLGRIKGQWFKWKRDPLEADLVVLYAQRGHGKRSSLYSDFTLAAWTETETGPALVPVAKAYSGFTDAELRKLDKFVRDHTTQKFGPVREVEPKLVVQIAFDSIHRSPRHKSGVAMRFPRFHTIRWEKECEDAAHLSELEQLLT